MNHKNRAARIPITRPPQRDRGIPFKNLFKPLCTFGVFAFFCLLIVSCLQRTDAEPIGDHVAFPVRLLNVSDTQFLLLNSNASNHYNGGSIQRYSVDSSGTQVLEKTFPIEDHGSDIALSNDKRLLALSFDGSKKDTNILFYNYFENEIKPLEAITLQFVSTGSKQSIKQLNFFQVDGYQQYFLTGVILTSPLDTGEGKFIPSRVFVAQIEPDFSSAKINFVLSYNLGDDVNGAQSLVRKSDSLKPGFSSDVVQYMLGSEAPIFDSKHNLFLALPTGSLNGFNDSAINVFPVLPPALSYFSAQENPNLACSANNPVCVTPDMRSVSLFVVDMKSFLQNTPLNLSLYFVPLAWNANGIPFGHETNSTIIKLGSSSTADITSYNFQTNFWSAHLLDSNTLLTAKRGLSNDDKNNSGNEVFQISGLDILAENIQQIETDVPITSQVDDFKILAKRQILDSYHILNMPESATAEEKTILKLKNDSTVPLSANWPVNTNTKIQSPGPLVPYMYSRSIKDDGKEAFIKAPTALYNFDTVCLNNDANPEEQTCYPYWLRATYTGLGNYGRDSSWLTTNIPNPAYKLGDSPTFRDALNNPSDLTIHSFKDVTGAQVCTTMQKTDIYCASFLTGEFEKFHFTKSGFVSF